MICFVPLFSENGVIIKTLANVITIEYKLTEELAIIKTLNVEAKKIIVGKLIENANELFELAKKENKPIDIISYIEKILYIAYILGDRYDKHTTRILLHTIREFIHEKIELISDETYAKYIKYKMKYIKLKIFN